MEKNKKIAFGTLLLGAVGTGVYLLNNRNKNKKINFRTVPRFQMNKFLGRWYEIARIENNSLMTNCLAKYIQEDDGSLKMIYSGFDKKKKRWKKIEGKLKIEDEQTGKLKVSFHTFLYSPYNIVDIDEKYENALIAGKNHDFLWLISREKEISDKTKSRFLAKAIDLGYDISKLTWTSQVPIEN